MSHEQTNNVGLVVGRYGFRRSEKWTLRRNINEIFFFKFWRRVI